ncbi:hypothetical protein ACFLYJ_03750 [Candidatus Cloacimonadota bacterium]
MLSILIPLGIIALILVYGFIIIKRHFIDKKPFRGEQKQPHLERSASMSQKINKPVSNISNIYRKKNWKMMTEKKINRKGNQ